MTQAKTVEILVIDDEAELREILCEEFERLGFRCTPAGGQHEALQILRSRGLKAFSVVISDIRMPDGNGIEILQWIRHQNIHSPAVVLMTGFADVTAEEAQRAGAAHLILKPFDLHSFVELVRQLTIKIQNQARRSNVGETA